MYHECGRVIGSTSLPVIATGNILDDVRQLGKHCIAAWCRDCRKATEYRYLSQLADAA